jgi:hypothetical protein
MVKYMIYSLVQMIERRECEIVAPGLFGFRRNYGGKEGRGAGAEQLYK